MVFGFWLVCVKEKVGNVDHDWNRRGGNTWIVFAGWLGMKLVNLIVTTVGFADVHYKFSV